MAIEVEKLVFAAEAELRDFERDMKKIPQIVDDVSRKAEQKAAKYAKANEQIQKRFADAGIREQKRLTNEVLREIDRRNKAESKAASVRGRSSGFAASFAGNTASNAVSMMANEAKNLAIEGVRLNASFDKLVRLTANLDDNFQTADGLKKLKADMLALTNIVPHSADEIAKASFSIKSSFSDLSEPELIEYLKQFGIAATTAGTDVGEFTQNTAALAKAFKVQLRDLPEFLAGINTAFKAGLAPDKEMAAGFNKLTTSIKSARLPLNDFLAAFGTIQSTSADAAQQTTNLQNALQKLGDAKYVERLDEVFNIDRFTKDGGLKTLNELINELAVKLKDLTPEEKLRKMNEVFTDMQASEGINSLINELSTYNKLLRDGTNTEMFRRNNDNMMASTEARWKLFWATIEKGQNEFGGRISQIFNDTFSQQTTGGSIRAFFVDAGAEIMNGFTYLIESASVRSTNLFTSIANTILGSMGVDQTTLDAAAGQLEKSVDGWFDDFYVNIEQNRNKYQNDIRDSQKKFFENVLASPLADESLKANARKSLDTINASIQKNIADAGKSQYEAWKRAADEAVKGYASGDEKAKEQARKTIAGLNNELLKAISDNSLSGEMKDKLKQLWNTLPSSAISEFNQAKPQISGAINNLVQPNPGVFQQKGDLIGQSFTQSVLQNIEQGRQPVQQAQNNLFGDPNTGFVIKSGFTIGTSLWQGMVQGINSGRQQVYGAAASLGGIAASATRESVDSHSPSKVFIKIGQDIVGGLIVGLDDNSPKVAKSIQKMTKEAVDSAYEQLGQSFADFQALRSDKMFAIKIKLAEADETKAKLEELIDLRIKLGANLSIPLPRAGEVGAELVALRQFNQELEATAELAERMKISKEVGETFFAQIASLEKVGNTKGFFRLAEEAGKSVDEFKKMIEAGAMAQYLETITKIDKELSDATVTSEMTRRAEAMERMSRAYEGIFDEKQQQEFANSYGIGVSAVQTDNEQSPEFKIRQAKIEFQTLSDFLDRTFTDLRENGWRGMLEGMVLDLSDALQQMFVKWITSQIFKAFNQPLYGADSGSGGGGFWSTLLGFGLNALVGGFGGGGKVGKTVTASAGGLSTSGTLMTKFIGTRAGGGDVRANRPYIVGEEGWEFFVPKQNGMIYNQKQLKSMSYAPNYNFPKNYASELAGGQIAGKGGGVNYENHFHFHADRQTGAFSRASATQEMKRIMDAQRREQGRR